VAFFLEKREIKLDEKVKNILKAIGTQEIDMMECDECGSLLHPYIEPKNQCKTCKILLGY
jgi:uncharacterized OB-fold protein